MGEASNQEKVTKENKEEKQKKLQGLEKELKDKFQIKSRKELAEALDMSPSTITRIFGTGPMSRFSTS